MTILVQPIFMGIQAWVLRASVLGVSLCNLVAIAQEVPGSEPPMVVFIADKQAGLRLGDFEESRRVFSEEVANMNDLRQRGIAVRPDPSRMEWTQRLRHDTGKALINTELAYRIEPLSRRPVVFSQVERPELVEAAKCFVFHMGRVTYVTRRHYQGNTTSGPRMRFYTTSFTARQPYSVYWRESRRGTPALLFQGCFTFEGTNAIVTRSERREFADVIRAQRRIKIEKEVNKSVLPIDELVRRFCRSSMLLVSVDPVQEIDPSSNSHWRRSGSLDLGFTGPFLDVVSRDLAYAFLDGDKRRPLRPAQSDGGSRLIARLQNPLPLPVRLRFGIEETITERLAPTSHRSTSSTSYRVIELGSRERKSQEFQVPDPRGRPNRGAAITTERRVQAAYLIWSGDPNAARWRPQE